MPPPQLPKMNKNLYNEGLSRGSNSGGRVQHPDMIVCYVCHRSKPQSQFSTRQLTKWKGSIYQPHASSGKVKPNHKATCKTCTPDQTTELTCIVCGETNGLQYFAKTQRKNPDIARCKDCITRQAETAPDLEVPDSDEFASSSDEEDAADYDTGKKESKNANTVVRAGDTSYAASSVNTNTLTSENLNRLEQVTGSVSGPRAGADQAEGGWVTKARKPPAQSQLVSETMTTMTYDSVPRNQNGSKTPSMVSDNSGSRTPLRSIPPKPAGSELRKNGWARAVRIPRKTKAQSTSGLESDDGYDDAEGSVVSGGSAWTDRKKTVKTDFEDDPWARVYK